jgi:hypothetical protein
MPLTDCPANGEISLAAADESVCTAQRQTLLPAYALGVLDALRFSSPRYELLRGLTDSDWKKVLAFCDRMQLTLALGLRCREHLPDWVQERIDQNLRDNAERWTNIKAVYREAASAFEDAGLEFAVLKGFSHCPLFVADPRHRTQYDVDLFFSPKQVLRAREIAAGLGYEPLEGSDKFPTDHLPTMIRKTGWEWRGDYFDTEIPLSLELHFRFWNERNERFTPKGLEQFWERRGQREHDGGRFTALHPVDALGYSTLHVLRHLLRGDVRLSHVYEIGCFLQRKATDASFWTEWKELHDVSLRRLEVICLSLVHRWFDCVLPQAVREEIQCLSVETNRWLEKYADSPLVGLFYPNKDELWLHWSLIDSRRDRLAMLRQRLLPERLPGPVDAVHLPEQKLTWRIRLRRRWRYLLFLVERAIRHIRTLGPTAASAVQWFVLSFEGRDER